MSIPKWTDERTNELVSFVGDESPVSRSTVEEAAERLETTPRSVASKLRKMEYEVEKAGAKPSKFTDAQESTLRAFVEDNSGEYTYAEIAAAFEGGEFEPKEIQGKILSMQLTEHVKPAAKPESTKTFTDEQEAQIIELVEGGAFMEDVAEALGVELARARGKTLSLLRSGAITAIPAQREKKDTARADVLDGLNVADMTVEEIVDATGKTARGIKTILTRRGLTAKNYDGAAKKEKAAS